MTQVLSSNIKLNEEQVLTTITNISKVRHLNKITKIYDGKASFTDKVKQELEKYNVELNKISRYANNYKVFVANEVEDIKNAEILKYNKNIKLKNYEPRNEIFIVVDSDKIDRQIYMATIAFYHLIAPYIEENKTKYNYLKPCVDIVLTNYVTASMKKHITSNDIDYLPCPYKIYSLCEVYPLCGSKNRTIGSFTKNYEIFEYEELYNKNEYQAVNINDPIVKIMNGELGDIIACQTLYYDSTPFYEYQLRQIKNN